jgi:hypothetical protein
MIFNDREIAVGLRNKKGIHVIRWDLNDKAFLSESIVLMVSNGLISPLEAYAFLENFELQESLFSPDFDSFECE